MHKLLSEIQAELKAPKGQYNKFGKYYYRSCEDIVEAVKPLLAARKMSLTISDEIISVLDRVYVKAVVTLSHDEGGSISVSASARESNERKGMDDAQLTGATSSYARKYALNGLFAIDDNKDADTQEYKEVVSNAPAKLISTDQLTELTGLINETKSDIVGMCNYFRITELDKLPLAHYAKAKALLIKKRDEK